MLHVHGKRCVVVGGGQAALRRARSLLDVGADVILIAPEVAEQPEGVTIEQRPYRNGDLDGAWLVIVATDDTGINETIARDATAAGVLVNRADDPDSGDFTVPAHAHHGPVTIAVHTGGISAAAAGTIRRQLSEALDPDWPILLDMVAPYRTLIQQRIADPADRRDRLRKLTDEAAMNMLKTRGVEALRDRCEEIAGS